MDGPHSSEAPGGALLTVTSLDEGRLRELLAALLDERLGALEERLLALQERGQELASGTGASVLLRERELAALLGVHPRTIRRLECNQEIPTSVQVGGSKRWKLQEVTDWIARLESGPHR